MESEERSSTGSTVSGVFKTILKSPTPICMFYFSHPFGVTTPQVNACGHSRESSYDYYTAETRPQINKYDKSIYYESEYGTKVKSDYQNNSPKFIPWPKSTWKRDYVLPPLIQFRGKRDDGLAPDLESVLRTIRQGWNSPSTTLRNQKHDTFWRNFCNKDNIKKMGLDTNQGPSCLRLLKRRYSVPEIIMRKHELAQQKPYEDYRTESVPSPKCNASSGIVSSNSTSSISRNLLTASPGSEGNLSRGADKELSLRKSSLLRQMWEKDYRYKHGKNSSLRLLQQKGFSADGIESHCEECRRLNLSRDVEEDEMLSAKYFTRGHLKKLKGTASSETSSSMSDISQPNSQLSTQESSYSKQGQFTTPEISQVSEQQNQSTHQLGMDLSNHQGIKDAAQEDHSRESTVALKQEDVSLLDEQDSPDSSLDRFISKMLIDNLRDLAEEVREKCRQKRYVGCFKNESIIPPDTKTESDLIPRCEVQTSDVIERNPCTLEMDVDGPCDEAKREEQPENNSETDVITLENLPNDKVVHITTGSAYNIYSTERPQVGVPRMLKSFPRTESIEVHPSSASVVEEDNCNNSEESLSLVDSLDDPADEYNDSAASPSCVDEERSNSTVDQQSMEKSQAFFVPISDSGNDNMNDVPGVADGMPEKLKERIEQRQLELDAKKEINKKSCLLPVESAFDFKQEIEHKTNEKQQKKKAQSIENRFKIKSTKSSKESLRNDVGLLESYTVDAKGNLQFRKPPKNKAKNSNCCRSKIITKPNTFTGRPPKPAKSSSSSSSHSRRSRVSSKDIQKMTFFQTQSDIITPDVENGPRRIYQKTEIQDGEKRIEILEIVECIDSSEDSSPTRETKTKHIVRSACMKRSRIPIPTYKMTRSMSCQRRSSPRDLQHCLSPRVDRAIAELLIGALNRSDQTVIEVIRSPKEILPPRSSRSQILGQRSTPKRSTGSGKYRQMFEVIPEERSSLSMDSSNEELAKDLKDTKVDKQTSTDDSFTICSNTTKPIDSPKSTSNGNRAREAVEHVEPKAWIGFLKRNEGSVDEEDESTTQPYANSTNESSGQQTLTSISTATAIRGSSASKKTSTTAYSGSSESDNILQLIEKNLPETQDIFSNQPNLTADDNINKCDNIIQVQECKNILQCSEKLESVQQNLQRENPAQMENTINIWRVQSPDICRRAIPKSKNCCNFEQGPVETETEIDSSSYVICSGESFVHPTSETTTASFNDPHPNLMCTKELPNSCTSCCFCNPNIHCTKYVNMDNCLYCNRRKTPQKREEETNTESDYFKMQDTYQSTSIRDHTHTMSRDSDSVSTKCTRTNEKIKRYIPESSRTSNDSSDRTKNIINRPKNVNNLPKSERKSMNKIVQNDVDQKTSSKKFENQNSKETKFPSPGKNFSSYGYDRSTSSTFSSDSTCSTTPEVKMSLPKMKCKTKSKSRRSREEDVKPAKCNVPAERKDSTVTTSNDANSGWTVTLAGTCSKGPPPDVEMRLSFPKEFSSTTSTLPLAGPSSNSDIHQPSVILPQDRALDNNGNPQRSSVLPPAFNVDSRRALPTNLRGSGDLQKEFCFPEVNESSTRNQLIPRQVTKKAIRHMECNVAVTSATRTISNFSRGRRTMSYQAVTTDPQKLSSRERQIRDSSLDLGFLSSRRMSFEDHSPLESMALTIMGNAIAPERKPRVPTMSEKDLTGRHNRCFTRNRAFFT